jgi:hypothetical protein
MQAPTATSNTMTLQVDGGGCYKVGGSTTMPVGSWTWVNYQNGSASQVMQLPLTAGNHSFVVTGTTPGVSLDNLLLLSDSTCVPTGFGTNCTTAAVIPPSTPTGLTAKASSPTSVTLNWLPSTTGSNTAPTGYYILRSSAAAGPYTSIGSASGTTYLDSTTIPNSTFYYEVEAYDAATPPNVSLASAVATVTTPNPPDTTPPSAPTELVATADGSSQINLSWTASSDNVGIAGYVVYRNGVQVATLGPTVTAYGDTGLTAQTNYSYYVVAHDPAGNVSAHSATVNATTAPIQTTTTVYGVVSGGQGQDLADVSVKTGRQGTAGGAVRASTNADGQYLLSGIVANTEHSYDYSLKGYKSVRLKKTFGVGSFQLNSALTSKS